jgi:uncharacterized membrane protein required for colicin V production
MLVVLNIAVIGLVLLIAYWWGSQGLFSSLLHLVATICAGAVALAFWEPLALLILENTGNKILQGMSWGLALLLPFLLCLFVFRFALDKLAPANLNFPHWADLTVGGALGFGSGTIIVGLTLISFGFVQSKDQFMGYNGYQRSRQNGQVALITSMWYPAHQYAGSFYEKVSASAFTSSTPMAQFNPEIGKQWTLYRDTHDGGRGASYMVPDGMTVRSFSRDPEQPTRLFVEASFNSQAFDFGGRLTLTSAQARLIEAPTSRSAISRVVYPTAWFQGHDSRTERGFNNYHRFDSISNVLSSEPGKSELDVVFEFAVPADFSVANSRRNAMLQVKGVRYTLPTIAPATPAMLRRMEPLNEAEEFIAGGNIDSLVLVNNVIPGLNASVNTNPAGINLDDEYFIVSGRGVYPPNQDTIVSRALRVKGIAELPGERVVMVNMSRGEAADVFALVDQGQVNTTDRLELVDDRGNAYTPIGYFKRSGGEIDVDLRPAERMPLVDEYPRTTLGGTEQLYVIFRVTEGARLISFRAGNATVGTMTQVVNPR